MEEMVELRKATKDDHLTRRRKIDEDDSSPEEAIELDPKEQQIRLDRITAINNLMTGNDPIQHFKGLQMAHSFLKTVRPRPIDLFVTHGIVPKLVEYLRMDSHPEMQYIACWVLTTVAFGNHEQTSAVVQAGAVDVLLQLLDSPVPRIVDQAIWCIGNISGDGPEMQKHLLSKGLVPKLVEMAESKRKLPAEHLSNIVWTLANMCENAEHPNEEMQSCLSCFSHRIFHKEMKVVREAVRGISMLSFKEEWLDSIYDTNVLTEVVDFLSSDDWKLAKLCLKIVGHFAAGSDRHVQHLIEAIALPPIMSLMKSTRKYFMKEATRTAGNIACGTYEQILTLLNAGVAQPAIHVLDQGDKDSIVEALHLLTNITTVCKMEQLVYLERQGVVAAVCKHLNRRNSSAIYNALKCIHNVLRIADKYDELDEYLELIEEAQGKEFMEQLQTHENSTISSRASYILDKYYNDIENTDTETESERGSGDTICDDGEEMVMQVSNDFVYDFN
jgi:hypothetical protein